MSSLNPLPPKSVNYAPSVASSKVAPSIKSNTKSVFFKPKPEPITFTEEKTVKPLKKTTASFMSGVANLFSFQGVKSLGSKVAMVGAGIAGGAALAIFAGPQIQAAVLGLTASAAFPPVGIAIAATVGAMLLAFGIYKLVKYCKARVALDTAAKEAAAQQATEQATAKGPEEVQLKSIYKAPAPQQPAEAVNNAPAAKVNFAEPTNPVSAVPEFNEALEDGWKDQNKQAS